jgi:hypothetical protein
MNKEDIDPRDIDPRRLAFLAKQDRINAKIATERKNQMLAEAESLMARAEAILKKIEREFQ